jgi:Uma2 family endonuclease
LKAKTPPDLGLSDMAVSVLQRQPEELTLRKLTISEYYKLAEVGVLRPKERDELLDGLLVQMAPIGPRHQSIVDQLNEEFSAQNRGRYKVSPGRPIPIPDFNEPQPDMVLFKKGVPTERHPTANEIYLVVAVSETTLKQDEGKKLLAYQGAGIPAYWIFDVAAQDRQDTPAHPSQNLLRGNSRQRHDRLRSVSRCHDRYGEFVLILGWLFFVLLKLAAAQEE